MAGYSGRPLAMKLGIKDGHALVLLGAPPGFEKTLDGLAADVKIAGTLPRGGEADVIVWFVKSRADFAKRLPSVSGRMAEEGGLWIAWPKKASKVPTDMTEDVVREVALPTGLVDNKVCAIDEVWSGLRLVIRRELRGKVRATK
jgi:hypothetical protein